MTCCMFLAKITNKNQPCFCREELRSKSEKDTKENCIMVKERIRLLKLVMLAARNHKSKRDKRIQRNE